ncbi:MAG: right-handed parallel beta-helix repeat-containing protein [Clostridiales bacterium]|nr:right-handed parallel beta-helix repeat-containing protein [Clostridiales bacterium]
MMNNASKILAYLLCFILIIGTLPVIASAANLSSDRPVIGAFSNHKDNEKNRFTFEDNNLGQTSISYKTKTNWDIAEAKVTGYLSEYTRLCVTAEFVGTKQFGIEVKVPGKSDQELRDATIALNKLATLNADGSYTYDISLSSTIRSNGLTALYFFLDPATSVSGTSSMKILDIGFRKAGEAAYNPSGIPATVYALTLDPAAAYAFPGAQVGYGAQSTKTVTVANVGNTASGSLNIALSGTNSNSFTLSANSLSSIAAGSSRTFTVRPKTGLAVGSYTATVEVSNGNVSQTLTVSFTVTAPPSANTYYVAKNGNNTTGDGSSQKPWLTIDYGTRQMPAGSTLIIRAGTYNEKLTNIKSGSSASRTVILGETGVILSGSGLNSGSHMIHLNNKSWIRIENLEICDNLSSSSFNTGIYIESSSGVEGIQLIGNKVYRINGTSVSNRKDGHGIGVYGKGSNEASAIKNILIEGNEVYNCKLGQSESVVVNGNVKDWQIINNYIHDNDNIGIDAIGGERTSGGGVAFDRARAGYISGNVVVNNDCASNATYGSGGGCCGIYVDGGYNIVIENNYVEGSEYGIELGTENATSYRPSDITIRNNIISNNRESCLLLGGSRGAGGNILIEKNTLWNVSGRSTVEVESLTGTVTLQQNIILRASCANSSALSYGSGNVYFGVSKPSRDTGGVVAPNRPIVREPRTNGTSDRGGFSITPGNIPSSHTNAGARINSSTTRFLYKVF